MKVITIQAGDTLYHLAKTYGIPLEKLIAVNGLDPHQYLVIGDALVLPAPAEKTPLEVNGYAYPFIDREVLRKTLPYLTYLSLFSYGVTEEGGLTPLQEDEPLIAMAKSHGVAPILVLTTVDESGGFNSERSVKILESPARRQRLADELQAVLRQKGYYGIDLDMEYIPAALREEYTALADFLRTALAPHPVFVALAPKTSREQKGLLYEAHDYAGMGQAADRALIMTYEWGHTFGPPMAVAPLPQVEAVLRYALTELPAEKIFMGLPNYGYDWRLPYEQGRPARSLGNAEAITLARRYGAQIQFDETARAPWFRYYDAQRRHHEVWFEDARSYQEKLLLARRLGVKGISIWNIMRYFQPLYTLLEGTFQITKVRG